jgi:hypothetical protein
MELLHGACVLCITQTNGHVWWAQSMLGNKCCVSNAMTGNPASGPADDPAQQGDAQEDKGEVTHQQVTSTGYA